MKLMRMALTGSLLLFLAACGNGGPIDPPTTTGGTTDGTTTGGTTGGTGGFPFPTTTGGSTTGGTTTGGTTTGGSTTGGSAGTISGTVTAPSGGDVNGAEVGACSVPDAQDNGECDNIVVARVDSTGAYTLTGLQAVPYAVFAAKDVDGNGTLTNGDYVGYYSTDGTVNTLLTVTPPQTGINITMQVIGGGSTPIPGELTGTWTGTTTTQQYGTEQTTFSFTQNGSDISGTLTLPDAPPNNPIEGTIGGSNVSVSTLYTLNFEDGTTGELEYLYEGTLSGTTLAGSVTLNLNGVAAETGSFSVTQGSAATTPVGKLEAKLLSRMFEDNR